MVACSCIAVAIYVFSNRLRQKAFEPETFSAGVSNAVSDSDNKNDVPDSLDDHALELVQPKQKTIILETISMLNEDQIIMFRHSYN